MIDANDFKDFRRELRESLNSIDERLRALELQGSHATSSVALVRLDLDDHEDRVRRLEHKVWTLSAVASGIGAALGVASSWLVRHT